MADVLRIDMRNGETVEAPIVNVRKALSNYDAKQKEKIDGLTMEQWDRVIKVEQPCEFWDFNDYGIIRPLSKVFDGIFRDTDECKWQHCRPIIKQGHTHTWWPELNTDKKPEELPDDAIIYIHQEGTWFYGRYKVATLQWHPVTAFYWPHDLGGK